MGSRPQFPPGSAHLHSGHIKGIYLSKALTCIKFPCINKNCVFVKETETLALLYEELIHLT